jgi:hypothetical protein
MAWHSNGQLYVPTNGSGGGGNSPASILGARRPNGTFYGGPDIPATKNVQVQPDHLFRINPLKNIGYFGHPNPKRGQFVPFRGYLDNPLYPVTIGPDIEYRGTSFDFGLNISANGVIEYKNNAFGGRLKGKLIVCRFSGGGDLIVLEPGSMIKDPNINSPNDDDRIYNIVRAAAGSGNHGMVGMSAFVNPLDLTEDVQTGNLYVIEFNWNGDPSLTSQITLLKVDEAAPAASLNTLASRTLEYKDRDLQTIDEEPSLKVYPNPTTDNKINVVLGNYEPQEKIDLEIYDMLGRLQKKSALVTDGSGSMHSQILLTNFPSDQYYIMKVSSARGSKLVKFFVR